MTEGKLTIVNVPYDPFWTSFSERPFEREFLNGEDDDEGIYLSRDGSEICLGTTYSEDIYLSLGSAVVLYAALRKAIEDLRGVYAEQTRYFAERSEQEMSKKIDDLPSTIVRIQQEANNMVTTLQAIKAFNSSDQNGIAADVAKKTRDQVVSLNESLKNLETILRFADKRPS